jgi:hypothetical protein
VGGTGVADIKGSSVAVAVAALVARVAVPCTGTSAVAVAGTLVTGVAVGALSQAASPRLAASASITNHALRALRDPPSFLSVPISPLIIALPAMLFPPRGLYRTFSYYY